MASRKCPICGVAVNTENLARHLQSVHPRDATSELVRSAEAERATARAPRAKFRSLRTRPSWRVPVAVLVIVLVAGGAYVVATNPLGYNANTPALEMCINSQHIGLARHDHALLTINISGSLYRIPDNVGRTTDCMRPVHTHTTDGVIHIESPVPHEFSLHDFFLVWGQPFSQTEILTYSTVNTSHTITMTVNSVPTTEFENFLFPHDDNPSHTQIVIKYQ